MPNHEVTELLSVPTASITQLVNAVIEAAYARGASDIHIDPTAVGLRIRLRIDGVLQEAYTIPRHAHAEVISRIKVMANMRTDEHQATQDGRFRYQSAVTETLDMRVSVAPTYHGENVVLRLLSDRAASFTLERLGFSDVDCNKILAAVKRPQGMILATGPTGSGKTTTLYTLIKLLNQPEVSIVTIEDPIEYAVADIKQIQVNTHTGLTFANGLRSILRQDPNIIMVGEIRDTETAAIAVNTALTGHLLLSTLHTSDAATTLPRLLDMGIDSYLVASTISIAIGQRLVRKVCGACTHEVGLGEAAREALRSTPLKGLVKKGTVFYHGSGCEACGGSGYAGRLCVSEVLVADAELRDAIMRKASAAELRTLAREGGMTTLFEDGYAKALSGQTSLEEILRVVHE